MVHGDLLRSMVSVTSPSLVFITYATLPVFATFVSLGGSTGRAGSPVTTNSQSFGPVALGLVELDDVGWAEAKGSVVGVPHAAVSADMPTSATASTMPLAARPGRTRLIGSPCHKRRGPHRSE